MAPNEYKICSRCLMDSTAENIEFNLAGHCNFCEHFLSEKKHVLDEEPEQKKRKLDDLVAKIKSDGKNKQYDCIVGVSGGLDSSMVLSHACDLGLRPLAVHMDNGWNSELAQSNIEKLIKKLGVDFHTTVIDWSEYKALMQAFFDADVVDVELLYDNAMTAVNYQQASKYGLKYILAGTNTSTEGLLIPEDWNWFKLDQKNIFSIANNFGVKSFRSFPTISTNKFIYYTFLKRIKWIPILDYTEYEKDKALKYLTDRFEYRQYPYKHYESVFTRFYQGEILPKKFSIDKRKVHFSTLIVSNQMTRSDGLKILQNSPYPNERERLLDIEYFLKKMGWDENMLQSYIGRGRKEHDDFLSEKNYYLRMLRIYKYIKMMVEKL